MASSDLHFEDIGRIIGHRWRGIPSQEEGPFRAMAELDWGRYRIAVGRYHKEELKLMCQGRSAEEAIRSEDVTSGGVVVDANNNSGRVVGDLKSKEQAVAGMGIKRPPPRETTTHRHRLPPYPKKSCCSSCSTRSSPSSSVGPSLRRN